MRFLIQWMRKRDSYDKTYFEEFYIGNCETRDARSQS